MLRLILLLHDDIITDIDIMINVGRSKRRGFKSRMVQVQLIIEG